MSDGIEHLDEPHPLADMLKVIERVQQCVCWDRSCDYCRGIRLLNHAAE